MSESGKTSHILAFRPLPVVLVTVITYLAISLALFFTNDLEHIPSTKKQQLRGLNLEDAWRDLRRITAHPHPYNSHPNDAVHSFILSRLYPLTKLYPHVHLVNDKGSRGSWVISRETGDYGVYFEGTNILVKIDPPEDDGDFTNIHEPQNGVLFSAHYDSVSTAPGATDDGMGVATLLQLVKYFAEKPRVGAGKMKKTVVFNVNNGEEEWLNGAHAFLEHPWSNLTNTFLNLEGAAAGGRPVLFRATSTTPVRAFRNHKLVPHPHANVLSSDAFARGLVRSGTDYSVYTGPRLGLGNLNDTAHNGGMQGLDLAFYKGRNRYHTKFDAAPYTEGGRKSLWAMMETARGVADGLVCGDVLDEDPKAVNGGPEGTVYFDIFRRYMVVFPLHYLLNFNIVILIVVPIVLFLLLVCERVFVGHPEDSRHGDDDDDDRQRAHSRHPHSAYGTRGQGHHGHAHHDGDDDTDKPSFLSRLWVHLRFWVSLAVTTGLLILLIWLYVLINPFAIYSSPYLVLTSFISLCYLSLLYFLALPSSLPFFQPSYTISAVHQKHTIFYQLYVLSWIFLVLGTVGITVPHPGLGSGYIPSIWNACLAGGCLFAAVEGLINGLRHKDGYEELDDEDDDEDRHHGPGYLPNPHDASERTPLVGNHRVHRHRNKEEYEDECTLETSWWIPQFLLAVPFPLIIVGNVVIFLMDALPQNLADGAGAWGIYGITAFCALFVVLPLAPFSPALSPARPNARAFATFVFLVFIVSTLYTWIRFPFSSGEELKVYFQQRVDIVQPNLGVNVAYPSTLNLTTAITGPKRYLRSRIIPKLPSAAAAIRRAEKFGLDEEGVVCYDEPTKAGLVTCQWNSGSGMRPIPGDVSFAIANSSFASTISWGGGEYFRSSTRQVGKDRVRIKVKGRNTRGCRIYFDSHAVKDYTVLVEGDEEPVEKLQYGYGVGEKGVKEIRLWSRDWEKEWTVDAHVIPNLEVAELNAQSVKGRVACEWAEYESGRIDVGGVVPVDGGKIPAYEEVLAYLPGWVLASKFADGLVEVFKEFEV